MGHHQQNADEVRQNLAEQLDWRFAERNDAAVAHALHEGQPIDAVYPLGEAGLLDGFFAFLHETEIMAHWQTLTIETVRCLFVPLIQFVLLYGMRVLFGITSTNALPSLLFSNVAVMTLIGFNAIHVTSGMTRRGASQRTAASEYTLMDPQTLANTICKISAQELERLFNGTIHCLAAFGVFIAEAMVAVDGTLIPTPATYPGCGCLKVVERQRDRQGVQVEVVKLVFGWRLIALIDLVTLIPLAIKVVQIQQHEAPHLLALVQQAQVNLAPYSRIVKLVVDRAYVDGGTLYQLARMGITFTLIAKSNMAARHVALAEQDQSPIYERIETLRHGHGREQWTEELISRVRVVTGIRAWNAYRPSAIKGHRLAWQDRPTLNAVVVSLWRNRRPAGNGFRVYLTNGSVKDPWAVVDIYDDRSWIENGLFRNSKQFWSLIRWFPQRTEAGVRNHLTFVMLILGTATAYRLWDKAQVGAAHQPPNDHISQTIQRVIDAATGETQTKPVPPRQTHLASKVDPTSAKTAASAEQPTQAALPEVAEKASNAEPALSDPAEPPADFLAYSFLDGQGVARWRRQLRRENRDQVIVFIGPQYGIFDIAEMLVLLGTSIQKISPHLGSRTDILRRYGCDEGP